MLYLKYRLRARHRNGRGIHPPFAFDIIHGVIYGKEPGPPHLEAIETYRQELLQMTGTIPVEDHGAGARWKGGTDRRICYLVRHTAVTRKKGRLLARLTGHLRPDTMIELGTGTGIGSMYLAGGHPEGVLHTCEGSPAIAGLAEEGFEKWGVENAVVHTGLFASLLPGLLQRAGNNLLLFIDGDHRGEKLVSYVLQVLEAKRPNTVILMDDIHWSGGMYRAWKNIVGRKEIRLSIELFNMGIVFTGEKIQKNHFVVFF